MHCRLLEWSTSHRLSLPLKRRCRGMTGLASLKKFIAAQAQAQALDTEAVPGTATLWSRL